MAENKLLSLAKAAALLGVHPTTLRRWADQGDILVMTTPGGHRRFPLSEISRLKGTAPAGTGSGGSNDVLVSHALSYARKRLASHSRENWIVKVNDEQREHLRSMGRDVLDLLKSYLDEGGNHRSTMREVEAVGKSYGDYTRRSGLSLADLLEATSFFRDSTLETAVADLDTSDDAFKETFRSINSFFNTLLVSASSTYT